jgi:hypothetical protein
VGRLPARRRSLGDAPHRVISINTALVAAVAAILVLSIQAASAQRLLRSARKRADTAQALNNQRQTAPE